VYRTRRESAASPIAYRGRGAAVNPGNRFEDIHLELLPSEIEERVQESSDVRARVATEVIADRTKSIINPVNSPDIHFRWTINPYRGCEHGCIYCYARPTHETLGYSCGLDFETKIVAKYEAPHLLRKELDSPKWRPEPIIMSGVTDPYQPIEHDLRITRRCLEVLADCAQPVSIVTKNRLVVRDLDLLTRLADVNAVSVALSITTLDPQLARMMEPRASAPAARLSAIRSLAEAGVPVMVMVAPIIAGLTDQETPRILDAAASAGARSASMVTLRLPFAVKDLFLDWLERNFPDRRAKVERFIREMRGGKLNESNFHDRFHPSGVMAAQIRRTFDVFTKRCGLDQPLPPLDASRFIRPGSGGQMTLFSQGDVS